MTNAFVPVMRRKLMTKKQIIIDGVNIKDCKRRIGKDNYCRYYKRPCSENNFNCIWKKYLRKEQEYKNLKEELRCYRRSIKDISIESTEICKILEKYKQALDKIEEFCITYSDNHDAYEAVYKQILDIISKSEV